MEKQVTIKQSSGKRKGVNVFNGNRSDVQFHPADDNVGRVFKVKNEYIPVDINRAFHYNSWRYLRQASCIGIRGETEKVVMVEHLLSAVYALGIDNLIIELSDGVCPRQNDGTSWLVEELQDLRTEGAEERACFRIKKDLPETRRTALMD